jgi:hypothetical protein
MHGPVTGSVYCVLDLCTAVLDLVGLVQLYCVHVEPVLDLCTGSVYCVLCTGSSCRSWSTCLQTSSTRRTESVYCVLCTVYCVLDLCTGSVYCVLCTVYCVLDLCTGSVYCVLCTRPQTSSTRRSAVRTGSVYCVLCTRSSCIRPEPRAMRTSVQYRVPRRTTRRCDASTS